MIKRMNKKGQAEGNTVNWIFALVVLVLLVLLVWGIYSYFASAAKVAPDDLRIVSAYCENSPFADNKGQYCSDFKELKAGKDTVYYDCDKIAQLSGNTEITVQNCATANQSVEKNYCETLIALKKIGAGKTIQINDYSCTYTIVTNDTNQS